MPERSQSLAVDLVAWCRRSVVFFRTSSAVNRRNRAPSVAYTLTAVEAQNRQALNGAIAVAILLVLASIWAAITWLSDIVKVHADAVMTATGLSIAFLGFSITVWQLRQTRSAAESASVAVAQVRRDLVKYDTFSELTKASAALNALLLLQLGKAMGIASR